MAGHNKWSKIKRQKAVKDQRRSNYFTKLGRAIAVAVKEGGGVTDPQMNYKLRLAIEKARQANMPNANIKRAIEQGAGKSGSGQIMTALYEGFGPAHVATLVEVVTDNKQRAYQEIRQIFDKSGGSLSQPGAVSFLFKRVGLVLVKGVQPDDEETALEIMEIAGVEDLDWDGELLQLVVEPKQLKAVQDALISQGREVAEARLEMMPLQPVKLSPEEEEKVLKFIAKLEDSDEVQQVYTNVDWSEE